MKNKTLKSRLAAVVAAVLTLALLAGCGASIPETSAPLADGPVESAAPAESISPAAAEVAGTVLLSVNPEIELDYDRRGLVLEVEGINDDGMNIVKEYTGYEGKTCEQVVNELVKLIYEAGYFEQTVDGHTRNVVIKLGEGSAYPDAEFLNNVARGVHDAVNEYSLASTPMTVENHHLDDQGRIGLERTKELALAQMGLTEATFTEREYELDDGVYELEFFANGIEYELEVDAYTGKVREADIERNDDWLGYGDDWDDRYDDDWDDRYDDDWDDRYDDDWDDRYDDDWDD